MAERIIDREYICLTCGKVRKSSAHYVPNGPPIPTCCGNEMQLLSYEQSIASKQLSPQKRIEWMNGGGKVAHRGGKRQWKPIK